MNITFDNRPVIEDEWVFRPELECVFNEGELGDLRIATPEELPTRIVALIRDNRVVSFTDVTKFEAEHFFEQEVKAAVFLMSHKTN